MTLYASRFPLATLPLRSTAQEYYATGRHSDTRPQDNPIPKTGTGTQTESRKNPKPNQTKPKNPSQNRDGTIDRTSG